MIKRFSTLYIGHIELENCGHAGTPADDRRYPNERVIEAFDTTLELAQTMDDLGTRRSGWPSTTSSTKATSASPTSRCWPSTSPTSRGSSRSAVGSTSRPRGTRFVWPRTTRRPTS